MSSLLYDNVDVCLELTGKLIILSIMVSFCHSYFCSCTKTSGIAGFTFDKMLHTTPDDAFDIIIKFHVRAPFRLIRQAAPYFRIKVRSRQDYSIATFKLAQGENHENRSIINVSSTSGLHGNVGQANYAAAKSAIIGLTKTIAKEWGPFSVRANTVAFGTIQTRYGHV